LAVNIHTRPEFKGGVLIGRTDTYRRKKGEVETKKIQRKIRIRSGHILLAFLFWVGCFFGIQRLSLFLLTWEYLNIKEIDVTCQRMDVRRDVIHILGGRNLGNLLLVDIGRLQRELAGHRWIRQVHIRKKFPSTLVVEIEERTPAALLRKEKIYSIDRDGVLLEEIPADTDSGLPLLVDAGGFKEEYERKLELAWSCLSELDATQRKRIQELDVSEYGNLRLRFKGSPAWLKLGRDRFKEKIGLYDRNIELLEAFGPLEYIDLRFGDRLILKPASGPAESGALGPGKEAF